MAIVSVVDRAAAAEHGDGCRLLAAVLDKVERFRAAQRRLLVLAERLLGTEGGLG